MARTFKQYGYAHDTSGSINIVVSVDGTEVFNGDVTAETEPQDTADYEEVELFQFDLPDDTSGDTAWVVVVTGSEGSFVNIGSLKCNKVRPVMTIPLDYFLDRLTTFTSTSQMFTAEEQTYIDEQINTRLPAEVRTRLQAGTSLPVEDAPDVMSANEVPGEYEDDYYFTVDKTQSNGETNDVAYAVSDVHPYVAESDTFEMTANLAIPTFQYDFDIITD